MFVGDALDAQLGERPVRPWPAHRRASVDGVCTMTLASSESKLGARAVAGVAERVGAEAGAGRHLERGQHAARRAGRAVGGHRLHVDAALDGDAARRRHRGLVQPELGERSAAGELELGPHEVDAEHLLGDGVLDLEARVGLDERRGGRCRRRRGTRTCRGCRSATSVAMRTASARRASRVAAVEVRRRGHLDDLLVAALEAALALPQVADARRRRRRRSAPRCGGRAAASSSANSVPSPNADSGLRAAALERPGELVDAVTMRLPRPPPPAVALSMIGAVRAERRRNAAASSTVMPPGVPRSTGTPSRSARARAAALSPNRASTSGDGPTNVMPASAQRAANAGFSLRKP